MQGAQVNVQRLVRQRSTEPLVPCTFADVAGRMANEYGSCGAMIPFSPATRRAKCPNCGELQLNGQVGDPPPDATILAGNVALIDADTERVTAIQVVAIPEIANELARSLDGLKWDAPVNARNKSANEGRLSGIVVSHRTFGYTPPQVLRRRYACQRSAFDKEHPDSRAIIADYLTAAEHVFRTQAHEVYAETAEHVRNTIPDAWRIAGTPWSSGIINNTAALPYHRDSNNIKGSWSAMLSARKNIEGGYLHLVDYDVYLAVPNGSISIFDGQSVLHGVTPFRPTHPHAYRYTAVAYSRSGLKVCCPDPRGEARRAAIAATEAEDKRAQAIRDRD